MTDINLQIEEMEALSLRHYPDDEAARLRYLSEKLTERLRAFAVMFQGLPVKEQTL